MGNAEKRARRAREKAKTARRTPPSAVEVAQAKAARRTCGVCQACCTALSIKTFDKPVQTRCQHQCATGCAIYADRPQECAGYLCMWRQGYGEESDRPDRLGAVLDVNLAKGMREVAGGTPGRPVIRFTLVEDGGIPPRVRMAMDAFLRAGEIVVLSYADRQTVYGPRMPAGLSFSKETLDEIDRRIDASKNDKEEIRVRVIPQSDGFARVEFTTPEESTT